MVGWHAALDDVATRLADFNKHNPLSWVAPPAVSPDVPLGEVLPEPDRLCVTLEGTPRIVECAAPTRFLDGANARLHLRWWPTNMTRRGTVVLVPPWQFRSFTLLRPMVYLLNKAGFDVVGYPTPFHFERTPQGCFSGELFATWDMPRNGWAIRTACMELLALVEALQGRGPVGLVGVSLGGYLSAMTSVVARHYPHRAFDIARMCLVVPPASILDVFLYTNVGRRYRRLLVESGGSVPEDAALKSLARPFNPGRFRSSVAGENILVVAGTQDNVVPIRSSRKLARAFKARLHEYEVGHVTGMLLTPGVWRDVTRFLGELPVLQPGAHPAALPLRQTG